MTLPDLGELRRDVKLRVAVVDGALALAAADGGVTVRKARSERSALAVGNYPVVLCRPTLLTHIKTSVDWTAVVVVTADACVNACSECRTDRIGPSDD